MTLSGGQRQRVAIGRALVRDPDLILFDEPLSHLDGDQKVQLRAEIKRLQSAAGLTSILVTHDQSEAIAMADRVAVMYLGQLVETGPAEALFDRPAHPYTQTLLDAVPVADPDHLPPRVPQGDVASPLTPPAGCVFHTRCEAAMPQCAEQAPAEREIGERMPGRTGHRTSCHLWK